MRSSFYVCFTLILSFCISHSLKSVPAQIYAYVVRYTLFALGFIFVLKLCLWYFCCVYSLYLLVSTYFFCCLFGFYNCFAFIIWYRLIFYWSLRWRKRKWETAFPPSPKFPLPPPVFLLYLSFAYDINEKRPKTPPEPGGVLLVSHYVGSLLAFPQLSITWLTTPIAFITGVSIIW